MTRSRSTSPRQATPRAVLYARISLDKAGEGAGVERQLTDLRKLAKAEGWKVVEQIVDSAPPLTDAEDPEQPPGSLFDRRPRAI